MGPRSRHDEERIETRWVDGRLEVEAWAFESGNFLLGEERSTASLRGDRIRLSLTSVEQPPLPAGGPYIACSFPVRIHFTLTDLPRREYEIELRVDDEPFRRGRTGR